MSVPSNVFDIRFVPSRYDSTLNSHSSTSDSACNIDHNLSYDCSHFDNSSFNSTPFNKTGLSLLHINSRSLNRNSNSISDYLSTLNHRFDIYGITESWFKESSDSNLIDLHGYIAENCVRRDRRGGGATLFVNPGLHYSVRNDLQLNCADCDSLFIEMNNPNKIIVGIIYKPEYVDYNDFMSQLERTLLIITRENKRCYIMGDFNLDLLKCDTRPKVNDFLNLFYSNNFFPCIDRPTRIVINENSPSGYSISLIDNIFTNDTLQKIQSGVMITDLSDHFPVFSFSTNSSNHHPKSDPQFIDRRQLKPDNIKGLKNALSLVNWDFVLENKDPDSAYNNFIVKFNALMNIHCPIIRSKLSKRKTPIKPWITKGLIKSIQTKDKLYKKYIKHPTINNKIIHTKYKNNLTQLLRLSKRNHISSEIELHKHNMKKMWGTLNNLLGRNRKQKLPDFFKNNDGIKVTDSSAIASYFNDFFTNIGSSLADRIPPPDPNFTSPLKSFNIPSTMFLAPTSSDEVDKLVKKMKASTTTGHDGISSSLLKAVLPEINSTLIHIFNLSLSTGVVPSQLKIAKVVPIYKAGDSHHFNNYRPISILPSISKVLERIIYNRIFDFISKHNILCSNQYGFRPNRTTHMALNDFYTKVTEDLDNKLHSIGIFLDLSKAFDTLNHSILINKLSLYGIRGVANQWISNYLSNRKQFVVFNGKSSPPSNITCGVPQGSILGPLLFLLYINDLPLCSDFPHYVLFADDTNILFSHKDPVLLENILNKELDLISNWFKLNKLSLNVTKTNFMVFKNKHSSRPCIEPKIKIDNTEITEVNTTKFLGVLIDNNLSWHSHTTHVSKIVSKYNGIIRKVRPYLPLTSLRTLYNTFILPYLNYCAIVWADKNNSHLHSLFLLQKRAIRSCTNSLWLAHTDPLFHSLNTLKLHDIYYFQLGTFMYKFHHNQLPPDLLDPNFFKRNIQVHSHETRHALDFYIDPTKTKLAENTIKTQGALFWNSLDVSLKNSPSISSFKTNLKRRLVSCYDSN